LGIKTTARAVIIVDQKSDEIVFQKNIEKVLPIASLTKLMTALVFLEKDRGDWTRLVEIKKDDLAEASRVGFQVGEKVKVYDLFYSTLIKSANDAARALARTAVLEDGKNFVDLMNEEAKKIGMRQTTFVEPTGLSPANQSTASDLVKLIKNALSRPEIRNALQKQSHVLEIQKPNGQKINRKVYNTNKLLNSFVHLVGAKTGYLEEAGYCYAGIFTAKDRNFIIVILGSATDQTRYQEAKGLIWWVEKRFLK
jgi:D-alanyl-D-alanine carboxypeptidase